jgi:excisionase family DNA binding protein
MVYERSKAKQTRGAEKDTQKEEILTVPMLARYLRCHPSTIYRLLKGKEIPAFKIGSDWRFQKSVIENWLRKGTIQTVAR